MMSEDHLLKRLRSPSAVDQASALDELRTEMERVAAARLGAHSGQAELQASSIVQDVMAHELARIREIASSDNSLRSSLFGEIKRLMIDRLRRRDVRHHVRIDPNGGVDPRVSAPGPGTEAARNESEAIAAQLDQTARLKAVVDATLPDPLNREICWLYMCEARRGQEVAAIVGIDEVANLRARAHRFRCKVAAGVLEAMRPFLSSRDFSLAHQLLVEKRDLTAIAGALDLREELVIEHVRTRVIPVAKELFGACGLNFLTACLAADRSARGRR